VNLNTVNKPRDSRILPRMKPPITVKSIIKYSKNISFRFFFVLYHKNTFRELRRYLAMNQSRLHGTLLPGHPNQMQFSGYSKHPDLPKQVLID
jgi:hypothetical protein